MNECFAITIKIKIMKATKSALKVLSAVSGAGGRLTLTASRLSKVDEAQTTGRAISEHAK